MTTMQRFGFLLLASTALLVTVAGCDEPTPPKKATVKTREVLNKWTQNVIRLDEAQKKGGVLAATTISATNYLDVNAQAYRTQVAKLGGLAVEQAMQMYNAEHGEFPKDYDEFMSLIIKKGQPDGIQLPMLPYYQEYAYDEANRKLVAVEFPALKEQFQKEQNERLGR
jgi:hypothetical protein